MAWAACIHGRTVLASGPVARPTCTDCEELVALRELENAARAHADIAERPSVAIQASLATLDRIRASRDTDRAPPVREDECRCGIGAPVMSRQCPVHWRLAP